MESMGIFAVVCLFLALVFDFTNGFHDAANSVATVVSTRVLTPRQAVIWAAAFNFIAFLVFGTAVAKTIGKGMIVLDDVNIAVIFSGLLGTVAWNIITWYFGIPTSSSHALIGGYAGAAIARAGFGAIIPSGWILTILFLFMAPLIGLMLGMSLEIATSWLLYRVPLGTAGKLSRRLQLVSAALYSLGHGGNDAQKTMGIMASILFISGNIKTFEIPLWVVLSAQFSIALGTLFGGWRIVKTMGHKITKLQPLDGFCAETASALSIYLATYLGAPVSTTHVITGAISGVGAAKRLSAVRWGVAVNIVWAWILTIPMAAIMSYGAYHLVHCISGS
jgi:PiT family inorganic phosphate transporter